MPCCLLSGLTAYAVLAVLDAFQVDTNYNQPMGTSSDWAHVAVAALFFGSGMLLMGAFRGRDTRRKPALSLIDVFSLVAAGLVFGIGTTFRWRAFHWPIGGLLVAILAIFAVAVGWLARRKLPAGP
jgi:hypothetical protein